MRYFRSLIFLLGIGTLALPYIKFSGSVRSDYGTFSSSMGFTGIEVPAYLTAVLLFGVPALLLSWRSSRWVILFALMNFISALNMVVGWVSLGRYAVSLRAVNNSYKMSTEYKPDIGLLAFIVLSAIGLLLSFGPAFGKKN